MKTARSRTATLALSLAAVLAVGACGGDDDDGGPFFESFAFTTG